MLTVFCESIFTSPITTGHNLFFMKLSLLSRMVTLLYKHKIECISFTVLSANMKMMNIINLLLPKYFMFSSSYFSVYIL